MNKSSLIRLWSGQLQIVAMDVDEANPMEIIDTITGPRRLAAPSRLVIPKAGSAVAECCIKYSHVLVKARLD